MEKHQQILELLLKEKADFDKYKPAYCEYDIQEILFPDIDINDIRIIMNQMCDITVDDGYDVIDYRDQDFGRNPLRFLLKNTYTKKFYEVGGYLKAQEIKDSFRNEEAENREQEKRIKDLQEANLEVDTKLKQYQDKYKVLDTFGKSLDIIIKSKAIILFIIGLSGYGLYNLVKDLIIYLIQNY